MDLNQAAEVLGIKPNSTKEQVRKAYRTLSKKYHPDNNQDNEYAKQIMQTVNAANMVFQKHFMEAPETKPTNFTNESTYQFTNTYLNDLYNEYLKAKKTADKFAQDNIIPQYQAIKTIEAKLDEAEQDYKKSPTQEKYDYIKNLKERLNYAKIRHQTFLIQGRTLRNQANNALDFFKNMQKIVNGYTNN